MYLSNGEIDPNYLLEEDLDSDEFREASQKLVERAYRKISFWESSVRKEKPVDEANSFAQEAARTAYVLDQMNSDFIADHGSLTDAQLEAYTSGNRIWRRVNEAGRQIGFEGKEPETLGKGDFCLRNGENITSDSSDFEGLEKYRLPSSYLNGISEPLGGVSFDIPGSNPGYRRNRRFQKF